MSDEKKDESEVLGNNRATESNPTPKPFGIAFLEEIPVIDYPYGACSGTPPTVLCSNLKSTGGSTDDSEPECNCDPPPPPHH